ncbi:hypothetical protein WN71_026130 [Streptomyces mangrovisoli]|uniref:SnoaL-like domain-containing protein n=1 Tax=Streptomyces mangrovisoli TaxID=1428628 RepID=A0A1J4NRQ0_9ACTN|nr:hypothetical protein WN71_026130 [Streptomyces mangrovisoli]
MVAAAVLVTVCGALALAPSHPREQPTTDATSPAGASEPARAGTASAGVHLPEPVPAPVPSSLATTAAASTPVVSTAAGPGAARPGVSQASALPPFGEGRAGDRAIQRALDAAWPADLPAVDERRLVTAGRLVLRADATGVGRAAWPTLFPGRGDPVTAAFSRLRIQAAIARRDGGPDRAVVHLVWAGCDRAGVCTDGRVSDWVFTRDGSAGGGSSWTPRPARR